jgi:hypothetical protein
MRRREKQAGPRKVYPEVPPSLMAHLDKVFPNTLPSEEAATEKELWLRLGAKRVVDHLRNIQNIHDRQDTNNVPT